MSTLSNDHLGEADGYERVNVTIYGPYKREVHEDKITRSFLSGLIMRRDRPKPHELKKVTFKRFKGGIVYRLYIQRDPCPVRYTGAICPVCRKVHLK